MASDLSPSETITINVTEQASPFEEAEYLEENQFTSKDVADSSQTSDLISRDVSVGESDDVSKDAEDRSCDEEDRTHVGEAEDVTPARDGGVTKQIMQPGTGDATPSYGERVHICYTGYYPVGNVLKTFTANSETCHFLLGKGVVVRGLDIGIATMKKNEQALFIIQPEYAYGSLGSPPTIPPYCVLFFKVELLDWKLEDLSPKRDDGIMRKIMHKGDGTLYPNDGATVKVEIIGYLEDNMCEKREVEFIIGEGSDIGVPEGIEIALLKFREKEKSMLYLKSPYAFGSEGKKEIGIPPNSDLRYEVTLLSLQRVKEIWEMNSDEKLEKAMEAKAKGVKYFKENNFKIALKHFKKIVGCLENEPGVEMDSEKERRSLLISGYLNLALCHMKLQQFIEALKICDKVLAQEPKNEKAMFRRAQCHMEVNDYDEALQDFNNVLDINADNKACKKYILECKHHIKKQNEKDKRIYNNMFKKFQDQDEEERKRRQIEMETGTWDDYDDKTEMEDN